MHGQPTAMLTPPDDPRCLRISLRGDYLAMGYDDRWIARRVRSGDLARVRRGAYTSGRVWTALDQSGRHAVRSRAVARQAQVDVVISHTSALPMLGAPVWGMSLSEVHVTRPDRRTGRREAGVRQHRGLLADEDVTTVFGVEVSSPIRAVLEVSTLASVESTLVVANHLLACGALTADDLLSRYDEQMDRWPGSLTTRLVLGLLEPKVESVGESRLLYFLWRHGFAGALAQLEIEDRGRILARLDCALPDLGVWLEFDGRVKYERHLRPGESPADAVLREKHREEMVAELTGWRCLRVSWADLDRPDDLEARLRRLVDSVARQRRSGAV